MIRTYILILGAILAFGVFNSAPIHAATMAECFANPALCDDENGEDVKSTVKDEDVIYRCTFNSEKSRGWIPDELFFRVKSPINGTGSSKPDLNFDGNIFSFWGVSGEWSTPKVIVRSNQEKAIITWIVSKVKENRGKTWKLKPRIEFLYKKEKANAKFLL